MDRDYDTMVTEQRRLREPMRPERKVIKHSKDHETFIREYPNHVPPEFCDMLMAYADQLYQGEINNEVTGSNLESQKYNRNDWFFWMTEGTSPSVRNTLLSGWSKLATRQYLEEFSQLARGDFWMSDAKVQITNPGEGFHAWHYDNAGYFVQDREFVFITYLNDVDGGETEFIAQGIRIKPEKGKTVIFPASYTHVHRGNPPLSGRKYIATTWASRLPRMDADTEDAALQCIKPSEQMISYFKSN